ncbi:hypothetical protein M0R45_021070 [Rubus argutus]|uniref:HTH myb-type domain-containing protein n=1 Tax=Rubus argutus TaxID=59490 RepID=A0AAW1XDC1_RUBAR
MKVTGRPQRRGKMRMRMGRIGMIHPTLKKPRVVWSVELHSTIVGAVNQLGIDKAVPKKILELMNVPGLTRENVASHLQKYRLYLRRLSGVSQHQSNLNNSFISSQEASFGAMSSLNGIDLQTLAVAGQLPAQSLATLQAAGLGRSTSKSGMPMPLVDQRNLFSFENPKLRFAEGQQHHSSGKPMNLLHGIPTTMEAKQLANLHQSAQSLGAVNMQVNPHGVQNSSLYMIGQPQSRGQILNETTGTHAPRLPSSIGQPMVSNGIPSGVLGGRSGISDGGRGTGYNPVPQNSSMLNFPLNNTAELPGNSYSLGSTQGMSSLTPKGSFPEEVNSEIKRSGGFVPSYDIFNELHQHKSNDWNLQNVGLTFDASHHANSVHGNLDSSGLVHQGFSSSQRTAQSRNPSNVGKAMFPMGASTDHGHVQNTGQHLSNGLIVDNTVRIKSERLSDATQNNFFHDQFGQEDLMSALLKQQQGGVGPSENEFDFDGYSLDNIPV